MGQPKGCPRMNSLNKKSKAGSGPAFNTNSKSTLLLGGDRVFCGFGDAELHDRLCLDLDRFARLRIASDAGLAMRLYQAAEAGDDEDSVLLGLFDCGVGEVLQKCRRGLVGELSLLGKLPDKLCLGQT